MLSYKIIRIIFNMLERIPKSPPKIDPLANDLKRPLWSVMIPSYNSITYLRDTIKSVLEQAPSTEEMQFEVIDDCSTDGDVEAVVKEVGMGRVGFFRHPENIGHYRNFEFCINRAKGKLIHILHGDDIVKPGFYQEIASLFEDYPNIGAAFTHCIYFDENGVSLWGTPHVQDKPGIVNDFLFKLAERLLVQPPSIVVKRSVYEHLGTFYGELYGEDWLMWVRIAANYEVAYSPKPLANYRTHSNGNITTSTLISGQNIKGMNALIDAMQEYLPKEKRRSLKNKAKRNFASYVTNIVVGQLYNDIQNPKAAFLQTWRIFKFYPSKDTFSCLLKTSIKLMIGYKGKAKYIPT